jgi:hypothetical protein
LNASTNINDQALLQLLGERLAQLRLAKNLVYKRVSS